MSPLTGLLTRRRAVVASTAALAVLGSTLVALAVRSDGQEVRRTDLNDGGVWVTSDVDARFGRLNKPAGQLDAGVAADVSPGAGLDVVQDGAAVVGLSRAANQLVPIDARTATLREDAAAPMARPSTSGSTPAGTFVPESVDLRGGTLARIDPATGKVWAQRVDTRAGLEDLPGLGAQARPLAEVGGGAVLAVGVDGAVHAVSGRTGTVATLRPSPSGGFAPARVQRTGLRSAVVDLTAVGSRWVVLDAAKDQLRWDGGAEPLSVAGATGPHDEGEPAYVALQQPGPDADDVLLEATDGATLVGLGDKSGGRAVALPDEANATTGSGSTRSGLLLSRPVRLGGCVHAAWAGPGAVYYGRSCGAGLDSSDESTAVRIDSPRATTRTDGVRLRVNRRQVVLNDVDSGAVWDVDDKPVKVDDWDSVIPPPQQQDKNTKKNTNLIDERTAQRPPTAEPDLLKARPGRVSTLHVLDNDSDTSGAILAIGPQDVTQPDVGGVSAAVSADGQTIQLTVPEHPEASTIHFSYTVNNGTGAANGKATGKVTVTLVGDEVNSPPTLRHGAANLARATYPAVAGRHLALDVTADWRDAESDPIAADTDAEGASIDGGGRLALTAPGAPGPHAVDYVIADDHGGTTRSRLTVDVLDPDGRAVPPRTQPDVVRGVVGKPVQVEPLSNDVPGADPTDPDARMRLASTVRGVGNLVVDSNLDTGVVTVTGTSPGVYVLDYAAQVGSATRAGRIRVDVLADPDPDAPPVAAPDTGTVRDQLPGVVDVLANDYSPRGDVLVTQRVTTDVPWLQASVLSGRWVHLQATQPAPDSGDRRGTVTYVVSDGRRTATGQVTVVQKAALADTVVPLVEDDQAVVRVGDAVTVNVLDNDSMADGIPLRLDPRGVKVVAGKGSAFASGSTVRYVPDPAPLASDDVATVEYTTYPEGLPERAVTGRITITVKPLPTAATPDAPPTPRSFSAGVTAGDTLTLTVPTSGVDPDGDGVTVTGIVGDDGDAVDLRLGRVVGIGATTIRYEAYPNSAGSEVIRYEVRDRFGQTGQGFVRVGVVPPSDPQPPVAVEDQVVAAPGRTVTAPVLDNDLISPDDDVTLEDSRSLNGADAQRRFHQRPDSTIVAKVPEEGRPAALTYGITDGLFAPSRSTLLVRGQEGYVNPPVAVDDVAKPKDLETSTLVDVLANDHDVDGDNASLKVKEVLADGASVEGRKVRVEVRDYPRTVPYVIEDADGATAMALIYVPVTGDGAPYVVSGRVIRMDRDSTVGVDLSDYVKDPRGRPVTVTSPDTLSTSPVDDLQGQVDSRSHITLTSMHGYVGPAALMLEVTDGSGGTDGPARTAYVSVPVQIGPLVPVLRCPDYEVTLVASGDARRLDVPRVCHAWFPQGLDESSVTWTADWRQKVDRVRLGQEGTGGRVVTLQAERDAADGAHGTVVVGARGSGETFALRVRVIGLASAPPPTLRPVTVDALEGGSSRTVDLRPYLDSPLAQPACRIEGVVPGSGHGVTADGSGCALTVHAAGDARGTSTFTVSVSDAPGRIAAGRVTVTVRGVPAAPRSVAATADRVRGGAARVSWLPPAYDGGLPVLEYQVQWSGRSKSCTASPCDITGLSNGKPYRFTVRARNAAGWSPVGGPSGAVTPDTRPGPVGGVAVRSRGDRRLTIGWRPPANEGSPVTTYQLESTDVGSHAGTSTTSVPAGSLQTVVSGLYNDDEYSFRVRARNSAGWGSYGPAVRGQSAGTPPAVAAPTLTPRTPTPSTNNAQVKVEWSPTTANGPALTRYTVYRRAGSGAWQQVGSVSATSPRVLSDTIPYDGNTYGYTVTATNGAGKESARSNVSTYRSAGVPQTPAQPTVRTPNPDYKAIVTIRLGSSRATRYSQVKWQTDSGKSGSWSCSSGCPEGGSTQRVVTGLSVQRSHRLRVSTCNDSGRCSSWSPYSGSFQPYGPPKAPAGKGTTTSGRTITYYWSQATNGRPIAGFQVRHGGTTDSLGSGARSKAYTYPSYSTSYSIQVRAKDSTGAWSGWTTISGRTAAAPQASIGGVHHGPRTPVGGCTASDCYRVDFSVSNMKSGYYDIACYVDHQTNPFYTKANAVQVTGPNSYRYAAGYCVARASSYSSVRVRLSSGPSGTVLSPWSPW